MVAYILTAIIIVLALTNFILGIKLYEEPKENGYFNNVNSLDLNRERNICADPKYIAGMSIIVGVLIGMYLAFLTSVNMNGIIFKGTTLLLIIMYLYELTRRITLKDGKLTLSKFFFLKKELAASEITGMYIYSYNKKFLKSHAYTTKLVITDYQGKKIKFTLSSIDNRAVLNMMKDAFGVNSYKMYISKKEKTPQEKTAK